jgi:hypothetical protein
MSERSQPPRLGFGGTGLPARLFGVLVSPRDTFEGVLAEPRWLDVAVVITTVAAVCTAAFLFTEVGQLAVLDQQVRQIESVGLQMTDQMYAAVERTQRYVPWLAVADILVGWPIRWALVAGVLAGIFGGLLGGQATYRQLYAVVVHSWTLFALRAAFVAPLNYARESIGGATSLGVFFPMLGEGGFPARLLGAVDLFTVWWIGLLSVGLSVVYRRRAGPVAAWLFGLYAAGAALLAAIQAIRGGV